jgi:BR serine/threonine kinase
VTPALALPIFRAIIYAVEYLHSYSICHRDLKLENILLDEHDQIKIADFGFARWMRSNVAKTSCGSPHYAAPEVIRARAAVSYDGRASDIWSCGVILYAMLTGSLPFDHPSLRVVLTKVKAGQFVMPDIDPVLQGLIGRILVVDPSLRIKMEDLKAHPGFSFDIPGVKYRFPRPLRLPIPDDPIDLASVDSDFINTLKSLGYQCDEEINAELTARGPTNAKMFKQMIEMAQCGITQLAAWSHEASVASQPILMSTDDNDEASASPPEGDQRVGSPAGPPFSMASVVFGWRTISPGSQVVIRSFESSERFEVVAGGLQRLFDENSFEWVHPNQRDIHARRSSQRMMVSCTIVNAAPGVVSVSVKLLAGSEDDIAQVLAEIHAFFGSLKNGSVNDE